MASPKTKKISLKFYTWEIVILAFLAKWRKAPFPLDCYVIFK